jgi:hypothetical protein
MDGGVASRELTGLRRNFPANPCKRLSVQGLFPNNRTYFDSFAPQATETTKQNPAPVRIRADFVQGSCREACRECG